MNKFNSYNDNQLYFTIVGGGMSRQYQFEFLDHNSLFLLLNTLGSLAPEQWGKSRLGMSTKFFCLTGEVFNEISNAVNEIKSNPVESEAKGIAVDFIKHLQSIGIGNHFAYVCFISPEMSLSIQGAILTLIQTSYLNMGKSLEEAEMYFNREFAIWFDIYTMLSFGGAKYDVGNKNTRCRFCGKSIEQGVTFNKIAHAISESLGNKYLSCNEECDDCNQKFGVGIEKDFIEYMHFNRSTNKISKKGGGKAVCIGDNFVIDKAGTIYVDEITVQEQTQGYKRLNGKEFITRQAMYRALCKYVIDLVDDSCLNELSETIRWINGEIIPNELPLVGCGYTDIIVQQPILDIYVRKAGNEKFPYCMAVLRCINLLFYFILPYAKSDGGRFIKAESVKRFEPFLQNFYPNVRWEFESFLQADPQIPWWNCPVNELVVTNLLEKKAEVDHSPVGKERKNYVDFPDLNARDIVFLYLNEKSFNEYRKIQSLSSEEKVQLNLNNGHQLWICNDRKLFVRSSLSAATQFNDAIFDYNSEACFEISDMALLVNADNDSISISYEVIRSVMLRSLSLLERTLREKYGHNLELYLPIEEQIDRTILTLELFYGDESNGFEKLRPKDIWNLKYLH